MKVNSAKLPVPILNAATTNVSKWLEKNEREAGRMEFGEDDKLSHLVIYVYSETASLLIEHDKARLLLDEAHLGRRGGGEKLETAGRADKEEKLTIRTNNL